MKRLGAFLVLGCFFLTVGCTPGIFVSDSKSLENSLYYSLKTHGPSGKNLIVPIIVRVWFLNAVISYVLVRSGVVEKSMRWTYAKTSVFASAVLLLSFGDPVLLSFTLVSTASIIFSSFVFGTISRVFPVIFLSSIVSVFLFSNQNQNQNQKIENPVDVKKTRVVTDPGSILQKHPHIDVFQNDIRCHSFINGTYHGSEMSMIRVGMEEIKHAITEMVESPAYDESRRSRSVAKILAFGAVIALFFV